MNSTVKALGIDRLSITERILLVEEIWDGIAAEADSLEIPQSHRDELDRRLADDEADPQTGSSWEEVKTRLLGKKGTDG